MNAWLITWVGTEGLTEANKIAGVLSGRHSGSDIDKLVDFLYNRTKFNVHEMAHFAHKPEARKHQSKVLSSPPGHILYGKNPWLYARQVKEFKVNYDDENDIEIISWVEHASYFQDEKDGYKLKEKEPEKKQSIKRPKDRPIVEEPIDA